MIKVLSRHPFPQQGGFIYIEDLLCQVIFLYEELI
jgi:hypothetical protein